jgi:hypothetical protein
MKEILEDYDGYNEYCREEEIKRLKEAIAWTYEVSESINERAAHTCRYYLYKRLRDCEKPSEPKALF